MIACKAFQLHSHSPWVWHALRTSSIRLRWLDRRYNPYHLLWIDNMLYVRSTKLSFFFISRLLI